MVSRAPLPPPQTLDRRRARSSGRPPLADVRWTVLEGVPVLPALRHSCRSLSYRLLCRPSLVERGEWLGNRPGCRNAGMPKCDRIVFQTAPTVVVKRHRAKSLKQPRKLRLSQSESTPLLDDHQPPPAVESPPLSALLTAPVLTAVLNYSLLALSEISLTAIIPVYLASSPLSLTPWAIGVFMGGMGIANGVFQALCTAALVERWGAKRIYQVAICAFFPLWALFPLAVNVASATDAGPHQWTVWLLAVIGVVLVTIVEMSFSAYFRAQCCVLTHENWEWYRHHLPLRSLRVSDACGPGSDERDCTDDGIAHADGWTGLCYLAVCSLERTRAAGRVFGVCRIASHRCGDPRGLVSPP
jgi:hypothetical protein